MDKRFGYHMLNISNTKKSQPRSLTQGFLLKSFIEKIVYKLWIYLNKKKLHLFVPLSKICVGKIRELQKSKEIDILSLLS